jgi:hypothetical protein
MAEEQWKQEIEDMQSLLDMEITNTTNVMDAAAIEKGIAEERQAPMCLLLHSSKASLTVEDHCPLFSHTLSCLRLCCLASHSVCKAAHTF